VSIRQDVTVGAENYARSGGALSGDHGGGSARFARFAQRVAGGEDLHHGAAHAVRQCLQVGAEIVQSIELSRRWLIGLSSGLLSGNAVDGQNQAEYQSHSSAVSVTAITWP